VANHFTEPEKGEKEGREREEEEGVSVGAPSKPPEQETTPTSSSPLRVGTALLLSTWPRLSTALPSYLP